MKPFKNPTGKAPIKKPYVEKVIAPAKLIHRNFTMEFMVMDSAIITEAKYPIH